MIYLANSFSLKMLDKNVPTITLDVSPTTIEEVKEYTNRYLFVSLIGHEGTAQLFTELLGVSVPVNRTTYTMGHKDILLVGLPSGGRLPEGKVLNKEELESLQVEWFIVQQH